MQALRYLDQTINELRKNKKFSSEIIKLELVRRDLMETLRGDRGEAANEEKGNHHGKNTVQTSLPQKHLTAAEPRNAKFSDLSPQKKPKDYDCPKPRIDVRDYDFWG
jgi:hypothetical protein